MSYVEFDAIKIGVASPEMIREWSYGEVKKPETHPFPANLALSDFHAAAVTDFAFVADFLILAAVSRYWIRTAM